MSEFSKAIQERLNPQKGRKKYRDLYDKQLAERATEHERLAEAFQETVKTMNGFSQLATQQVKQIAALSKTIADMKMASPSEENGENHSEETEVDGE